jgi:hypothetical protein
MNVRQREILELFVEAQRLGRGRHHLSVVGNGGAHLFFRDDVAPQVSWRRKINAETKAMRPRPLAMIVTPPERVEPCACGGAWEHRAGSRQVIHVGRQTQGCARAA